MGYGTRDGGWKDSIKTFWPDDTDKEFYIEDSATIAEIMSKARQKWPDLCSLGSLKIESKFIHTDCLTYDQMDFGDYTNFLRISKED